MSSARAPAWVPLAPGGNYEVTRPSSGMHEVLLDRTGARAASLDRQPTRAESAAGRWTWSIDQPPHHAWTLVFRDAVDRAAVLRVCPRGEIVKYRMFAVDGTVCALRQNPINLAWHLSSRLHTLATIELDRREGPSRTGAGSAPRLANELQLGLTLPAEPALSLCLLSALLCIEFEGIYARAMPSNTR